MTEIQMKPLTLSQMADLYSNLSADFPASELKPWQDIQPLVEAESYFGYGFYLEEQYIGYAALLSIDQRGVLLDYLAVLSSARNLGLGSKILALLYAKLQTKFRFIIIEAESVAYAHDEANAKLRQRRINFYLRNGVRDSGILSHAPGYDVDLLIADLQAEKASQEKIIESLMLCYKASYPAEKYEAIRMEKKHD